MMEVYKQDIEYIANLDLPWHKLKDKSILVTGGTGLIGSTFINVLLRLNDSGLNCKIYIICRNTVRAEELFGASDVHIIKHDIINPITLDKHFDFILHLASNTHPVKYADEPVETILTNVIGLKNVCTLSDEHSRVLFASSCEIYGENRNDAEKFDENYCGYINCNTLRAGYTESKRCCEALCQAYIAQHNLDIVIARFARIYGPNTLKDDSKVINQFIKNATRNENIVLKSDGNQEYSFLHSVDAVSGLFYVLLNGNKGEAYNIADERSDIKLKDLAKLIANERNRQVIFSIPNDNEKKGFSVVNKAKLDSFKIAQLGWKPKYDIVSGIKNVLEQFN